MLSDNFTSKWVCACGFSVRSTSGAVLKDRAKAHLLNEHNITLDEYEKASNDRLDEIAETKLAVDEVR